MHEAQVYDQPSSFVTLTYDALESPSLAYGDFQLFRRRLAARCGPSRFFVAGEYGADRCRPHFHALPFGRSWSDAVRFGGSRESPYYRSATLESLWPHGYSTIGAVNFRSAAYVASYSVKSGGALDRRPLAVVDPDTGDFHYLRRPFVQMSRRPGLGYAWFQKYWPEVYQARDGCVLPGGKVLRAPRYYDKLLSETAPDLREFKDFERYVSAGRLVEDSSPARLLSREVVALSQQKMKGSRL